MVAFTADGADGFSFDTRLGKLFSQTHDSHFESSLGLFAHLGFITEFQQAEIGQVAID